VPVKGEGDRSHRPVGAAAAEINHAPRDHLRSPTPLAPYNNLFVKIYLAKYLKSTDAWSQTCGVLPTFCESFAEHRVSIRTPNPIESTFWTVRRGHGNPEGNGSLAACLTMV
jgi:hypothetical protein